MDRAEVVEEFKNFINSNRGNILNFTVPIEELPDDDPWVQDDEWDELYKSGVIKNGQV